MIRIEEAQLHAFGKFHGKKICFSDGLQIFYGANEAGKSTLQLFLKVMLYGLPNQRKSTALLLRDRERMIPWGEKFAEGSLLLTFDNKRVEIYRRFGKTTAGDKLEVRDAHTGESLPEFAGEEPGVILFGISAEMFEKTFWVRQDSPFPIGSDEELSRRLMNLRDTGEEEVSAQGTLKQLEQEAKLLRAKDKRGTAGLLDTLYQEREKKVQQRFALLSQRTQRQDAQTRREAAEQRLKEAQDAAKELKQLEEKKAILQKAEGKRAKWEEARRLQQLIEDAKHNEAYLRFASLTDETLEKAETIKRNLETLDQTAQIGYDKNVLMCNLAKQEKKKRNGIACVAGGAIAVLLALILGVLRIPFWLGILLGGILVGVLLMLVGGMLWKKADRMGKVLANEQQNAEQEELQKNKDRVDLENALKQILEAFSCENVEALRQGKTLCQKTILEAESYQKAYETLLAGEDIPALRQEMEQLPERTEEDAQLLRRDIAKELHQNQEIQMDALSELKDLEGRLSYVFHEGVNPADVEAEILQIDKEIAEGEEKLRAVALATKVFQKVYEIRKSDFTPEVNEKVNQFLDILSSGKYQDVRVADSYRMRIGRDGAEMVEAEYFSRGTYEQMYLALRLSLGSLIGDGSEPLFLDDVLTSYDDTRAKCAVQLLSTLGKDRQVFLFTCHERVKDFGQACAAKINALEEEMEYGC